MYTSSSFLKYLLVSVTLGYAVFCTVFFLRLNELNNKLLQKDYGSFELLQFNSYQPVKYFFICFGLILLAIIGVSASVIYLRSKQVDEIEMWLFILLIAVLVITSILTIKLIAIPIFQAILGVTFVGSILVIGVSDSN